MNQISEVRPVDPSLDISKFYKDYIGGVLVTGEEIQKRIRELASDIYHHYQNRPYVIIVVLKGSINTFQALYTELQKLYVNGEYSNYINVEYVRIKSYTNDKSDGDVKIHNCNFEDFTGKEVMILEDIVDTGLTIHVFKKKLEEINAKDIKIFTLLDKYKNRKEGLTVVPDFVGFSLEFSPFVIGFGLDFNEYFRDINHICIINKEGIEKFKV